MGSLSAKNASEKFSRLGTFKLSKRIFRSGPKYLEQIPNLEFIILKIMQTQRITTSFDELTAQSLSDSVECGNSLERFLARTADKIDTY